MKCKAGYMRRNNYILASCNVILCSLVVFTVLPGPAYGVISKDSYEMLIIGPELYVDEVQRFIDFKMSWGIAARYFSTEFIDGSLQGSNIASKIHEFVAREYERSGIKYLLLIGTYGQVPARYVYSPSSEFDAADFNYKPTDWYYGVPDWDGSEIGLLGGNIPKIAVGRLPVNSEEELNQVISKMIAVEKDFSRRRLLIFDGLNGALNSFLGSFSAHSYMSDGNLTAATLNHVLSVENIGHVMSYTHGSPDALWTRTSEGEWKPLMTYEDARALNETYGIHYLIACFAGALDLGNESLARALITSPAGPVVVIASSRVEVFDTQISSKFWESFFKTGDVGLSFIEALQSYLCDQEVFSSSERRFQKYNLYLTKVIYGDISWRISEDAEHDLYDLSLHYAQPDSRLEASFSIGEAPSLSRINGEIVIFSSIFLFLLSLLYYFLILLILHK
ncbi:hypothetical protein KEJ34_03990 [Candidatus Bathyarchaeota archaeon]|nr:hypothetical protein [Candidatus Bathyarchaeota archaeon]